MDLGIQGTNGIVCGALTDLGRACAIALAREGVNVTLNAPDAGALAALAEGLCSDTGLRFQCAAGDVTTPGGREALLAACPRPDILVNHAPGPPQGNFRDWTNADWQHVLSTNMLAAIELIRLTLDGMCERGFGRIVNITSTSVRAPMPALDLSNAARAGLTGFVAGVAREARRADVTINNLLPGNFETASIGAWMARIAAREGISEDAAMQRLVATVPLRRLGRVGEFGATCAFLCSRHAGYINAQNILLDGGAFPGVV